MQGVQADSYSAPEEGNADTALCTDYVMPQELSQTSQYVQQVK